MTETLGCRRWMAVIVIALLATVLGGCGGPAPAPAADRSSPPGEVTVGPEGVQSITLTSGDDYRFVPAEFTVTPGQVSVTLVNEATQLTHSFAFPPGTGPSDIAESIPVVGPTESDTIELTVSAPGEYRFICSFHEALGHTGVMTVAP